MNFRHFCLPSVSDDSILTELHRMNILYMLVNNVGPALNFRAKRFPV